PTPSATSIADAIHQGGKVIVEGVVTTSVVLIDPSGRLLVLQDATAAIEVRLPVAGSTGTAGLAGHKPGLGAVLRVAGTVGRAYGAPRLSATSVTWLGSATQPTPLEIRTAPGPALEWRLVHANGRLSDIHKLGTRWRAELTIGSTKVPIVGLTGAQIAVGRLLAGRQVSVIGIVRRAYPTALDRRFAIEPRSVSDLAFSSAGPARTNRPTAGGPLVADPGSGPGVGAVPTEDPAGSTSPIVDLRDLAGHRGQQVRVAGLVTSVAGAVIELNDGTARGRLVLSGAAAAYLDLVEAGDPLGASGLVELDDRGPYLAVTDPDGVAQAGDPAPGSPAAAGGVADPPTQPSIPAGPAGLAGSNSGQPASAGVVQSMSAGVRSTGIDPLEALGLCLLGAIAALVVALPVVRWSARRARLAQPSGPEPGS
ncbi:MAG: hypothetical protein ACRDGQ_00785, partial [Candidatus Limnocylindrales bacterium]